MHTSHLASCGNTGPKSSASFGPGKPGFSWRADGCRAFGLFASGAGSSASMTTRMVLNRAAERKDRPLYLQCVAVQPVKRGTADVAGIEGEDKPSSGWNRFIIWSLGREAGASGVLSPLGYSMENQNDTNH